MRPRRVRAIASAVGVHPKPIRSRFTAQYLNRDRSARIHRRRTSHQRIVVRDRPRTLPVANQRSTRRTRQIQAEGLVRLECRVPVHLNHHRLRHLTRREGQRAGRRYIVASGRRRPVRSGVRHRHRARRSRRQTHRERRVGRARVAFRHAHVAHAQCGYDRDRDIAGGQNHSARVVREKADVVAARRQRSGQVHGLRPRKRHMRPRCVRAIASAVRVHAKPIRRRRTSKYLNRDRSSGIHYCWATHEGKVGRGVGVVVVEPLPARLGPQSHMHRAAIDGETGDQSRQTRPLGSPIDIRAPRGVSHLQPVLGGSRDAVPGEGLGGSGKS